jgi:hypothetical protein
MNKSTTLLQIPEPSRFHCESDEDHFFAWLEGIPAVKSVVGTPDGLTLTIEHPIDRTSFYELVGLMTRYQLEKESLRQLCEGHADVWFNDAKNYWYTSVFG